MYLHRDADRAQRSRSSSLACYSRSRPPCVRCDRAGTASRPSTACRFAPASVFGGSGKSWRSARRRGSIICSSRPAAPLPRRVVTADSTRAVRSSAQLQGLCAWPGCPSEVHRRARSQTADTRVACMRSFAIWTCRLHYCEPKPYTLNHARRATQPRPTGCTTLRLRQACALS